MSSRVRQDEPPGRSRQRRIANLNETTSPNFRLNFRLAFLSFVYFGKQPQKSRDRHFLDNAPHERAFSTFHRPSDSNPSSTLRPSLSCPIRTHPSVQPLHNHFPNHPTTTPTITQPRLNHPSCRIQERFRLNHPTSMILQRRQQPNRY